MEILKIEDVFSDLPELETPRLLLNKLRLEDAAGFKSLKLYSLLAEERLR